MSKDEEIQLIAYQLWERDGCCHGRDIEHWVEAEYIWEQQQKPVAEKTKSAKSPRVARSSKTVGSSKTARSPQRTRSPRKTKASE